MAKKNKTYTVMVDVKVSTDLEITADSFEQALEKAKEYKTTDIVEFSGSHNDSEVKITGVYSND